MREHKATRAPITAAGLAALQAELDELEGPRRRELADRIRAARALGDLKENAEYHIAKNDQAHLETRIRRLREQLADAVVVDGPSDDDSFAFGHTAEVVDEANGEVHRWRLVGSTEADVEQGRLSIESPVGRALMNRRVGEVVTLTTPRGARRLRIGRLLD
jgi:transcription elongation factor GreA